MISIFYETPFYLENKKQTLSWIEQCVKKEGFALGAINYIFCDDAYLHDINITFLKHDTFTDIISFDNTVDKLLGGDIFISVERVSENAKKFEVSFEDELHRVIIHGILHYMGYKDKNALEKKQMSNKEDDCLSLRTPL